MSPHRWLLLVRSKQKLNMYVAFLAKLWLECDYLLLSVNTHSS